MHLASRSLSVLVALGVIVPALAEPPAAPVIATANSKVLVQRGQEFVPATPDMALLPQDKIVVLEGGNVDVACDGFSIATFTGTGVYPVPACPTRVAAEPPAATTPPPTQPPPSAPPAKSGSNWGAIAGAAGGVVLLAAAAGGGGGSDKPPPPPVSP